MDIKKITERDWEKYERMQNIAKSKVPFYLYLLLSFVVVIILIAILLQSTSYIKEIPRLNTSAIPALTISNHTLLPLTVFNNSKTYNQTLVSLISNHTRLAQMVLYTASTAMVSLDLTILLSVIGLTLLIWFCWLVLTDVLYSPITGKPISYKHLRRRLENKERQKQKMTNRLLAANYTEKDMAWYFDMEDSLGNYKW